MTRVEIEDLKAFSELANEQITNMLDIKKAFDVYRSAYLATNVQYLFWATHQVLVPTIPTSFVISDDYFWPWVIYGDVKANIF